MTALPFEIVLGIYLGVLTGIVPALIAGVLGFLFKYVTNVSIPGLGVVVLALGIAGVNGGLMALNDESIRTSEDAAALVTAIIVVLMLALYAHYQGDKLGGSAPKRISFRTLRDRTLSTDVIELVGGLTQVRVTVAGEVGDIEGYPPLTPELRAEIKAETSTFPADLPVAELETRFADRLQSELDLADVTVTIDERARATVAAAPPMGSTSRRVPEGKRAVSVSALVPSGLTRGEAIRLVTADGAVRRASREEHADLFWAVRGAGHMNNGPRGFMLDTLLQRQQFRRLRRCQKYFIHRFCQQSRADRAYCPGGAHHHGLACGLAAGTYTDPPYPLHGIMGRPKGARRTVAVASGNRQRCTLGHGNAGITHDLGKRPQAHDLGTQFFCEFRRLKQSRIGKLRIVRHDFLGSAPDCNQPAFNFVTGGRFDP